MEPPKCPDNVTQLADEILRSFQKPLWPLLLLEAALALGGNALALWRLWVRARPWAPAAVLSAQLALSHLLLALTLPPQAAYLKPPKHWPYGELACRLERFAAAVNVLGGAVFTAAIALARYLGAAHPMWARGRLRPSHAWAASALGWALSAALALPTLRFARLQPRPCGGPGERRCKCLDSAGDADLDAFQAYLRALAALGCALPLLLTLAASAGLGLALRRSHGLARAEKLRVAALVATGVALFAAAYVPYHALGLLNLRARRAWLRRCGRSLESAEQVRAALDTRVYAAFQAARVLLPLAGCLHPLLFLAAVPGLCRGRAADSTAGQTLEVALPRGSSRTEEPEEEEDLRH